MYLSLSLGPGMTINYFAMTLRGEGGKGSKTYHNDGIFKFWRLCSTERETTCTIAIVFVEHSVLVHSDRQGWGKLFRFKLVNRLNMWLKKSLPEREDFLMLWCQYTVSKQLEHGWNPNPTLLKYHAETNQHAMEMHEKDQIILKVMLYFNSFWILWTKTRHQTDEKKGVMEKPSISIPSSHRFIHLTKTILNTATNANEVFYMSSTTLLPWKGLVQFQLEEHSTGWRLVSAHPCLIVVTHVKNMRRRYLVVGKSSTDFTRVEMQHQVGLCYIHLTCTFQPTQCHYF